MKISLSFALLIAVVVCTVHAQTTLDTQAQKFGYAVGVQVGQQIQRQFGEQGEHFDKDAFLDAVKDVLGGGDLALPAEDIQAALQAESTRRQQEAAAKTETVAEAGRAYLVKNREVEGVVETDSGLQYRIIEAGSGKIPTADDTVVVHYRGTLINGEEFDSSYSRGDPATFPVTGVIQGWVEALQLMKEGAKWELVIPSDLAYGARGSGSSIGPNATLIFEVELIKIQ